MVGTKTYHLLRSMGIEKVKTVQEMPVQLMESVMGKNGIALWKKAQGVDNTPVIAWHERKSISMERTFEKDSTDVIKMRSILTSMAENLSYQLRVGNKLTACVSVKIRYSDFQTYSRIRSADPPGAWSASAPPSPAATRPASASAWGASPARSAVRTA